MEKYQFKWGNKNKVATMFNIPVTTLNDWVKAKAERCRLLELAYNAIETDASLSPEECTNIEYIHSLGKADTSIDDVIAAIGLNGKANQVLNELPAHEGWALRQLDSKRLLVVGLLLGYAEDCLSSILAKYPELSENWSHSTRRSFISMAHHSQTGCLQLIAHVQQSRKD